MQWKIHGERPIYTSKWVSLWLVDVELPDGQRFEHHVVRMAPVAAAVVVDDQARVLMLWRHRFITDTWGWEIPTGIVEDGETPQETAAREVEEETGWRPGPLRPIVYSQPSNGISNSEHHLFRADGATYQGPPTDTTESDRIEWVPLAEVRRLIDKREIVDGPTLTALLYTLAVEAERDEGARETVEQLVQVPDGCRRVPGLQVSAHDDDAPLVLGGVRLAGKPECLTENVAGLLDLPLPKVQRGQVDQCSGSRPHE